MHLLHRYVLNRVARSNKDAAEAWNTGMQCGLAFVYLVANLYLFIPGLLEQKQKIRRMEQEDPDTMQVASAAHVGSAARVACPACRNVCTCTRACCVCQVVGKNVRRGLPPCTMGSGSGWSRGATRLHWLPHQA